MSTLVVIDIETYYSRDFSLSKISTEAYVRSSQFEPIGLSLKINDAPGVWYPKPEVNDLLRDTDWSDSFIICQNTAFDGAILNWRYGVNPKGWMDTLGMSRALYPHEKSHSLAAQAMRHFIGKKGDEVVNALGKHYDDFGTVDLDMYAQYCINDGELTYKLFKLYMGTGFPRQELELIDLTLRMFIEPALVLDKGLLETHLHEVQARKLTLLEDVRDMMLKDADPDFVYTVFSEGTEGIKKLLMSNEKFADVLRRFNVEPPMKKSPTTGKMAYAFAKTDEGFTALAEHENFDVQGLVAARLGTKTTIEESRTERFIEMADRGAFPVPLRYYGAATGRWSGQDKVNLQNLPSRGKNAGRIKKSMLAPPGHVVIDCDSSQIEARVLAWLAGQDDLVAAFERKEDVYKLMATYIYNVPIEEVTYAQRTVGKTVVLGAGYGVGHVKLQLFLKTQANVDVTLDEAKRIIDTYRATYPKIPAFWKKCEAALRSMSLKVETTVDAPGIIKSVATGGFTLPNGLTIQYPDLVRIVMRDPKTDEEKTQWSYTSKGLRVHVYGGKCLAGDTPVLTPRGWVPLIDIQTTDLVWDGAEWVQHQGLTYQGEKDTIILNGVRMTPDHQVLTSEGWKDASSCQGLHRADVRMPDGSALCGVKWETFSVGVPMRMRSTRDSGGSRHGEIRSTWWDRFMRVPNGQEKSISWPVKSSRVLGMEVYARSVSVAISSGMGQLRRARDTGMSAVGEVVRGVLGRYGRVLHTGAHTGPQEQRGELYPSELPMDNVQSASRESEGVTPDRHAEGAGYNGHPEVNTALPLAPKPVYDLINAGPRTRFMVLGDAGPFVVHNCVENICQAVARIVIGEQMLRIAKRYKVVLTVHDAIAVVVKEDEATEARAYVEACMSWRPKWAQALPLACESGTGASYGDC